MMKGVAVYIVTPFVIIVMYTERDAKLRFSPI